MDGVVVDYHKSRQTQSHKSKGFFENMEPIKDAIFAIETLSENYNIYFASTAPWSNIDSWSEKRIWIEKHFPKIGFKKLILTHNKGLLMGDYLIDDRKRNGVKEFNGVHIHFGSKDYPDWDTVLDYFQNI